jgi:hypothetical protein
MLKEALEFLAGLVEAKQETVKVVKEGSTLIVDRGRGTALIYNPMIDVNDLNTNTISGFVGYVNSLTEFYPYVRVDCDASRGCLSVRATGGELGVNNFTWSMNLPYSEAYRLLTEKAFHGPEVWIDRFRSTELAHDAYDAAAVVAQLQSMEWHSASTSTSDGIATSRASYGEETKRVVSTAKESALADVQVHLRHFSDESLAEGITRTVSCYWEFNHAQKTLNLTPCGKDLLYCRRLASNRIQEILASTLDRDVIFQNRKTRLIDDDDPDEI